MMMSEFACMEDWDLQAVVRGRSSEAYANVMTDPPNFFSSLDDQDLGLFSTASENFEAATDFEGLEGLYKPFYPVLHQTLSPLSVLCTTTSTCIPKEEKEPEEVQKPQENQPPSESATPAVNSGILTHSAKSKKRKNLHKRVVQRVTEDDLSSDKWAWRKYGQKPIKGSPYPRSYYRCSSLKGCLARKQVERCSSDPSKFIVTYSAEHSHAHPTRRNSLAGSTRCKSMAKEATAKESRMPTINDQRSPALDLSPTAPSMASIEGFVQQHACTITEEEEQNLEGEGNETAMSDTLLSDDFFPSLDDFEELLLDQFAGTAHCLSLSQ